MKGHTIDECRTLKYKIHILIDNKIIQAKEAIPNILYNPLPDHRGDGVHVIETDEEWDPRGLIGLIREGDDFKPAVTFTPIVVQIQPSVEVEEIRAGSMNVKAFDGSQRATIVEINLCLQMGPTLFDIEFQVLDISATYNLLLGRPWIHAAGAVASTLHQVVKFEWNHQEVIIHGDGSNPIYTSQTIQIIENKRRLGGETYHHIEHVNVDEKDKWWSNKIESILAWFGYEPGKGLGKELQGITKPVQLKRHNTTFGGRRFGWAKEPVPRKRGYDCSAIIEEEEEEEEGLTIQTVEKGVVLRNWTATPSWARRVPGFSDESITVTCNEITQYKDSDSEEEDEIPEEVVREVENFENKHKSNMEETEAINLGDPETVKETRISIHLSPLEKKEYICFLKEYEDIFAWSYDDMTGLSTSIVSHKLPTNSTYEAFEYDLGQQDETGREEKVVYHLSKKFTPYEERYSLLERTCCALTWTAQKLRHYFCAYTTYLLSRIDPLKYIFQKPMPIGKLAKWQILLSEFDIIYVTRKAVKGQAVADVLLKILWEENRTTKNNEEVSFIGEDIAEAYDGWRMFFDGAANFKGVGIGAVLVSEKGQQYPISTKLSFPCTNNMAEYEVCIMGLNLAIDMNTLELLVIGDSDLLVHQVQGEWTTKNTKILPYLYHVQELMKRFTKIEFKHVPKMQIEFADALATLSSMIKHSDKNFIDPIPVRIYSQPAYYAHVEEEIDEKP
ncbi:uncharacterized protein [Nicotiana sylvestris]|uniref:uncharacterized protein n=1 Tax=Nicotiana sylvestris TaxID=4096 RepID=UPI00388CE6DB